MIHVIRNSLKYVPWNDMKLITHEVKAIYEPANKEDALETFDQGVKIYPVLGQ